MPESGAFASFVGKMVLSSKRHHPLKRIDVGRWTLPLKYKKDSLVAAVIEEAIAPYEEEIEQVLGYKNSFYRYFVVENPMDNFITDASMWKNDVDILCS